MFKIVEALTPIDQVKQKERITLCKECKFFVERTQSCGPLIKGRTLTLQETKGLEVSHYRKKIKLCGCHMPTKVKFNWASCPADKWGPIIEFTEITVLESEKTEILNFLLSLKNKKQVESEELKRLFQIGSHLMNKRLQVTTCPPCVKDLLDYLIKQLTKIEI